MGKPMTALVALGATLAAPAAALMWGSAGTGDPGSVTRVRADGISRHISPREGGASAAVVCAILRRDPTPVGRSAAFAYLDEHGYRGAYQQGYALGVLVDVACPDMWPVLRR